MTSSPCTESGRVVRSLDTHVIFGPELKCPARVSVVIAGCLGYAGWTSFPKNLVLTPQCLGILRGLGTVRHFKALKTWLSSRWAGFGLAGQARKLTSSSYRSAATGNPAPPICAAPWLRKSLCASGFDKCMVLSAFCLLHIFVLSWIQAWTPGTRLPGR